MKYTFVVRYPDYITCPYQTNRFRKCRALIFLDGNGNVPQKCPNCNRSV